MNKVTTNVSAASGAAVSPAAKISGGQSPVVGFGVVVTGTITYDVQHTFDPDPTAGSAQWFTHLVATGKSANYSDSYAFPITGIRINVTAGTTYTAVLTALKS